MLNRWNHEEKETDAPLRCNDVAPFLTALFDGEAEEADAQHARAHLLACERCAQLWLEWNRNRALLRNEAAVAPPPTLLWRVLLACRLSSYATRAPRRQAQPAASRSNWASEASAKAASGQLDEISPIPPVDLSARILAHTVGPKPTPARRNSRARAMALPAFAAPALGLWLMAAQWQQMPSLVAQNSEAEAAPQIELSIPATPQKREFRAPDMKPAHAAAVKKPLFRAVAAPPEAQRDEPAETPASIERSESQPRSALIRVAAPQSRPAVPEAQETRQPRVRLLNVTSASAEPQNSAAARVRTASLIVNKPAQLSSDAALHTMRASALRVGRVSPALAVSAPLRVSAPALPATTLATSPRAAPVSAPANPVDAAEAEYKHVEEVSSMVADYRALFASGIGLDGEDDSGYGLAG